MSSLFAPTCRFCTRPDPERIVLLSDNFFVQLSLGPIVEGYTLLVSKQHVECCAAISTDDRSEFVALQRAISGAQLDLYGDSTFYEHGRTGSCLAPADGDAHCNHAHLHIVPTGVEVAARVAKEIGLQHVDNWDQLAEVYSARPVPYILTQENQQIGFSMDPIGIPRQYLRTIVAEALGKPLLADWMRFPGYDRIKSALVPLGDAIREHATALGLHFTVPSDT